MSGSCVKSSHPPRPPQPVKPLTIRMHERDNVAIVANDGGLPAGAKLASGLTLREHVPQGHKVALVDLPEGTPVLRYNVTIGYALKDIPAGSWVHERLLKMPPARALENLPIATVKPAPQPPLEGYTFEGYRNPDGSVGTRNILAITTTVQCVAGVVEFAVKRIKAELLPRYPNVDDVVGLEHTYGCGVAIDAPGAEIPIRTLRNISLNPNFGGEVMVVSLGCEKLQPERLLPPGTFAIVDERNVADVGRTKRKLDVVCLQDDAHVGFMSMIDSIMRPRSAPRAPERAPARDRARQRAGGRRAVRRQRCVLRRHREPGGRLLHRPAGARRRHRDVLRGHRSARRHRPAHRARDTPEVAEAMIREMAWYDAYLERGGVDRSANTTPGNKKGGLSNIVEKAMGSIVKSGSSPISGVLSPGEKVSQKGLIFAATPASDFICGTLQLAAGMNLHVFTTGRGTPYGLAEVPVIKVATRSDLARRWHDLMDVNAGRIADGSATIEEVGWELFRLMLDVASGRKEDLGRALEAAQRAGAVQPGAGDIVSFRQMALF